MNKGKLKSCPRCGARFECGADEVWLCQCAAVPLSEAERNFVAQRYCDCLCANCLRELKAEFLSTRTALPKDV
ncbi:MAG: cysteine-rich CWC family protein [Chloroherpetonaceae bacterium]|nr:cysteine-rich CWC family protein [Chloroherpetonaceae bacterium]MDW8438198.1 cysteine-rich CWC family protein [Chloroherpetonaceae bacterium]